MNEEAQLRLRLRVVHKLQKLEPLMKSFPEPLTWYQLANLAGIDQTSLARMRKGKSGIQNFKKLEPILDELLPKEIVKNERAKYGT